MAVGMRAVLPILLLLLLGGCAGIRQQPLGNPESPYPPPRPPEIGDVLHLPTGIYVGREQMLAAVTDARIVYVGETHDNPASHRLQLDILRAMAERWPGQVSLGMEMFTPAQQEVLDDWVAGRLDEKTFLKRSRWFRTWSMDFGLYRDLLELAREKKIPIRGLNADKKLVSQVGRKNLDQLPAEARQSLPKMDLNDPYQTALVKAIFGGHSAGKAMLEGFQRVQTLWDETMAASIADWLARPGNERMRMVVVAGGNHVRNGFGIPRRVFRRLPTSYVLVGSHEIEVPEERKDRLMNVRVPAFPMPPFDYLLYTRYEIHDRDRVKLGVILADDDGRVVVGSVVPGSNADRAGLRQGDVILRIGGQPVKESFDLVYEISRLEAGDERTLDIERQGERLQIDVRFEKRRKK
ncbi:putative iron-regulated protein [Geothermobacter ehrlichii]|uniref:Putative iron-regulated protein n=1 Tax=Geothermobacter ehrlichii TaxID=213224 RepID=A0A5D3WH30_9BACT|nr:ChaN family lipoprotein [Geothermobacter ehrlichii]TYO97083.1 putative iron-regulated protein [Geothermobacter ehrlichii]